MEQLAQTLVNGLALGGLYALVALGVTLVFTVMGLMNLAHGELIMVGAYAMFAIAGAPFVVAVLAALAAGILVAVVLERLAFRPVRSSDVSTQLVTSLAVALLLQNLVVATVGQRSRSVATPGYLGDAVDIFGLRLPLVQLIAIALTVVLLVALGAFLFRTRTGVAMRAAAENFDMARLLGVNANKVIATTFALSGALAAAVAVLLVAQRGTVSPGMGLTPVLIGFVAVTIGGFGRMSGAVLGGLILGLASAMLEAYLPENLIPYRDAMVFTLPILILAFRPYGLLGGGVVKARV